VVKIIVDSQSSLRMDVGLSSEIADPVRTSNKKR